MSDKYWKQNHYLQALKYTFTGKKKKRDNTKLHLILETGEKTLANFWNFKEQELLTEAQQMIYKWHFPHISFCTTNHLENEVILENVSHFLSSLRNTSL